MNGREERQNKWKRETKRKDRVRARQLKLVGLYACLTCSRNLSELVPNGRADTDITPGPGALAHSLLLSPLAQPLPLFPPPSLSSS